MGMVTVSYGVPNVTCCCITSDTATIGGVLAVARGVTGAKLIRY